MRCPRAESRYKSWIASLWILALIGLLFLPTEYRGGAEASHNHALIQILLDAQDGQFAHTHSHPSLSGGFAQDWLDPEVPDESVSEAESQPDVGQQQERASMASVITFLVVMPLLPIASGTMPRILHNTQRLSGREPQVFAPPPRALYSGA